MNFYHIFYFLSMYQLTHENAQLTYIFSLCRTRCDGKGTLQEQSEGRSYCVPGFSFSCVHCCSVATETKTGKAHDEQNSRQMCAPKKDFVQNLHNKSSAKSRVFWIKNFFKIWFISGKLRGFSLEAGKWQGCGEKYMHLLWLNSQQKGFLTDHFALLNVYATWCTE